MAAASGIAVPRWCGARARRIGGRGGRGRISGGWPPRSPARRADRDRRRRPPRRARRPRAMSNSKLRGSSRTDWKPARREPAAPAPRRAKENMPGGSSHRLRQRQHVLQGGAQRNGKPRILVGPAPACEGQASTRHKAVRQLAKLFAGSAKNITPKRENSESNRAPPEGVGGGVGAARSAKRQAQTGRAPARASIGSDASMTSTSPVGPASRARLDRGHAGAAADIDDPLTTSARGARQERRQPARARPPGSPAA